MCNTSALSTGPIHASTGTLSTSVVVGLFAVGMAPLTTVLTFTAPNMMRPQGSVQKEMSKLLKAASYLTRWRFQPALTERRKFNKTAFRDLAEEPVKKYGETVVGT